jgi:hypothetical protein
VACNKADIGSASAQMHVSALTGEGLEKLACTMRRNLVPDVLFTNTLRPWLFDDVLK